MKKKLATLVAAGVMMGAAGWALAQDGTGQGRNGFGYGGPPKTEEERAARQAACLERNGGVCPNGGPRAERPRYGMGRGGGQGQGWGHGWRRGARDGTGPRGGTPSCPVSAQTQTAE